MRTINRFLGGVALGLGILVLAVLFIFPTRDTKEESQAAFRGIRDSVYELAYDDARLSNMEHVVLDEADFRLMQIKNKDTGQAFTEAEVRRLKHLRRRFPQNRLIPRFKTAEEIAREAEEQARLKRIEHAFSRRTATAGEVREYYAAQSQSLRDWKELLEYVVDEEKWSPQVRQKYALMLKETERIGTRIERQRERTLALNRR